MGFVALALGAILAVTSALIDDGGPIRFRAVDCALPGPDCGMFEELSSRRRLARRILTPGAAALLGGFVLVVVTWRAEDVKREVPSRNGP